MVANTNIDYITTSFEFPVLSKVSGRPTYESLKKIKDELKTNASTVSSDLGGGANGHLGLVLTDVEYTFVSAIPYVKPVHPGQLVIPPATTNYVATSMKEDHKEAIRVFKEAINVEQALIKQLGHALPELYLKRFRNRHTNSITETIPNILTHLFTTYGKITPEELETVKDTLKGKVFNIEDPLVIMYNEIEDLKELAQAATAPMTDRQVVNLGLQLIKNTNDFERAIEEWVVKPLVDQTWLNFTPHFEAAHDLLRQVRGNNMRNTIFQRTANSVTETFVNEIREELKADRQQVLQHIAVSEDKMLSAISTITDDESNSSQDDAEQANIANMTVNDKVTLEVLKLLKEIKNDMKNNARKRNQNSRGQSKSERNAKKKKRRRLKIDKYCWSCGAWNHASKDCRNKKDGHQDEATFENKMNGSVLYCQDCNEE